MARNELMELKRNLQTLEIELQSISAIVRRNGMGAVHLLAFYCHSKTSQAGYFVVFFLMGGWVCLLTVLEAANPGSMAPTPRLWQSPPGLHHIMVSGIITKV